MNEQMADALHWDIYRRGIDLFNCGEYFEAHEVWEELWNLSTGRQYDFIQGLIQAAVALVHYQRENPRGMANLQRSFHRKLDGIPNAFMSLNVGRFLADMDAFLDPVTKLEPLPGKGEVRMERGNAPRIRLENDRPTVPSSPSPVSQHSSMPPDDRVIAPGR